jgi:signal transduction histidine kinase
VKREGDYIETRISDFGSGLAEEIREKIFEEGFTAGESRGSGLGLFIARKLIESYDGKISAEPNEPSGTTFVVSLPRVKKA